jgi:hypothetical protein
MLLETHSVNDALIVAGNSDLNCIAEPFVESDARRIVCPGLNAEELYAGRHGRLLQPREEGAAQAPSALRRLNAKKCQMCRSFAVVHDPESQQAPAIMRYGNVRAPVPNGPKYPCLGVAPHKAMLDEVTGQVSNGASIARHREANWRDC